ncbi:MAG: hypothetical protein Q8L94_17040 [Parvibaculum sp.]|uniref:hypothetical protein n=1 Tax=Parvibaculum sp. TaxID=2024848 RepID=UPI002730000C|nr:hypothetical protein [Parvibaculum sp.]MDP1628824.1 hypothetical protein [Parvibaculum sp.]MDP2148219.1 hypothetical protein [Parvibaculum sp.]
MQAAFAFALVAAAPAQAGPDIPRYDVPGYCTDVAAAIDGSHVIYGGCMDQEQQAYNSLKRDWESIPADTRSYCDSVARSIGGSYTIMEGCIDQELSAARSNEGAEFEY